MHCNKQLGLSFDRLKMALIQTPKEDVDIKIRYAKDHRSSHLVLKLQ